MSEQHVVVIVPLRGESDRSSLAHIAKRGWNGADHLSLAAFRDGQFEWIQSCCPEPPSASSDLPDADVGLEVELGMTVIYQIWEANLQFPDISNTEILVFGRDEIVNALEYSFQDDPSVKVLPCSDFDYGVSRVARTTGEGGSWGPDRPTYTLEYPAQHVIFNSTVDNPSWGDERNFVHVRPNDEPDSAYASWVSLTQGTRYTFRVFFRNSISSTYALASVNARVKVALPRKVAAGDPDGTLVRVIISADNAEPSAVWDAVRLYNDASRDMGLRVVSGSSRIHTRYIEDAEMPTAMYREQGALIGCQALDGKVSGRSGDTGYITFECEAHWV